MRPPAHPPRRSTRTFQSTHPLRGATKRQKGAYRHGRYFNPRTPCGVRPRAAARRGLWLLISIHAPLAGCDVFDLDMPTDKPEISIHAPLAGCDGLRHAVPAGRKYFNPRTPCGVRPPNTPLTNVQSEISIHAPLAGCDPARPPRCTPASFISIHAPLAGCDTSVCSSSPAM